MGDAPASRLTRIGALCVVLLVGAGGALLASPALAISRAQANQIALRTLKPEAERGRVVLFGLKAPLRATDTVFEGGTRRATKGPVTITASRLGKPAWLFWEDLAYDARFEHPSKLLLIDDKTGKVLAREGLQWYPLVNGRNAPFLGTGYHDKSFQVFSSVTGGSATGSIQLEHSSSRTATLSLPPNAFKDDCIVMIGLSKDPQFAQDFQGMSAAAGRYGIRAFTVRSGRPNVDPDGKDLGRAVNTLTKAPHNCKDILIYIDGHGYQTGLTGVNVGWKWRQVGTTARGRTKWEATPANVTSDDLVDILKGNPQTTFKLVIDACFSGRFVLDLPKADYPNMLVLDTAARADEFSYSFVANVRRADGTIVANTTNNPGVTNPNGFGRGEFTNGFLAGLQSFADSPTEVAQAQARGGSLLGQMVQRAFTLGMSQDFAATE